MLTRRSGQLSLSDMDEWYRKIPERSVWHQVRVWSEAHIRDEDFAHWYAATGRPSIPPSFMMTLTLLQFRQGWSDNEAVEAALFDDRAKYALSLSRSPEITCDRSTLCKFRARLFESDMDRQILGQTLRDAGDSGLLGDDEDLVDSFMVAGAAARQGTFTLIRQGIRLVQRQLQQEGLAFPVLRRDDYDTGRKASIAWQNPKARHDLLQDLVADARTLVSFVQGVKEPTEALLQRAQLLQTVTEQDIEPLPDGSVGIANRVAPDRVISTVDEEMRHGRKTTSVKRDGYKGHVLTTNRTSDEPHLVTAVVVTPANVGDGDVTARLVQERRELSGQAPTQVMGDTAYGSEAVADAVRAVSPDTTVVAPVPPVGQRKGKFSKLDFTIDTENHAITCPAGHTIPYKAKQKRANTKPHQVVQMDRERCKDCPLRAQCVDGKGPRTLTVRGDEAKVQAKRVEQQSELWQSHYRERSRVEHVNKQLTANGGRDARYYGMRKTEGQLRLCASVHNIVEIGRVKRARTLDSPSDAGEKCA
ncbi:MAG: IS1182 family transposase [Bacilli bacterium]